MSEETHDVVRAKSFELVDEEGELRALMASDPNGSVGLEIYEDEQTPRLTMGINGQGTARMDLRDAAGTVRARLAVESSGTPTIFSIRDSEDRIRAQVAMHDGEAVGVNLMDATGDTRAQIMVEPSGHASIILEDTNGNVMASVSNDPVEMDPPQPADIRIDLHSDTFVLEDKDVLTERLSAETDLRVESEVAAYADVAGEPPPADVVIYVLHTLIPIADVYKNVLASAIWDLVKTAFARRGEDEPGVTTVDLVEVEEDGSFRRELRIEAQDPETIKELMREFGEDRR